MTVDERRANWPGAGNVLCDMLLLITADGWKHMFARCLEPRDHDGDHLPGELVHRWVWEHHQEAAQ